MTRAMRWLFLLVMPTLLAGCLFAPGKFVSTLSVNADRSFAFTYVGEVYSVDPSGEIAKGMADMKANGGKASGADQSPEAKAKSKAEADRKNQEIAEALAKGDDKSPANGMGEGGATKLDGVFTLDTDAEVVSQNNEDGVKVVNGRKTITWKATPLTKDAPTAVLRFKQ